MGVFPRTVNQPFNPQAAFCQMLGYNNGKVANAAHIYVKGKMSRVKIDSAKVTYHIV